MTSEKAGAGVAGPLGRPRPRPWAAGAFCGPSSIWPAKRGAPAVPREDPEAAAPPSDGNLTQGVSALSQTGATAMCTDSQDVAVGGRRSLRGIGKPKQSAGLGLPV